MSDIADVLREMVRVAAGAVYPSLNWDDPSVDWDDPLTWDGTKSITGTDIVVYPGWPASQVLTADILRKKTHITVYAKPEERNTTRYPEREIVTVAPVSTITFSSTYLIRQAGTWDAPSAEWDASGAFYDQDSKVVVTLGGTVSVPQNLALRINNKFYTHSVQAGDTLASIAAALAALVLVDVPGTSATGPVITVGSGGRVQAARAGGFGTVAREVRRQERLIQVIIWAATPDLRDTISAAVDVAFAQIRFLTMPDGFGARLIYKNSPMTDGLEKSTLYRRDLNYLVEYATTVGRQAAAVVAPSMNFNQTIITA